MKKNLLTIALALVAMCANAQDKVSTATTWDFESYQSGATISNEIKNIKSMVSMSVVLQVKAMTSLLRFTSATASLPTVRLGRPVWLPLSMVMAH